MSSEYTRIDRHRPQTMQHEKLSSTILIYWTKPRVIFANSLQAIIFFFGMLSLHLQSINNKNIMHYTSSISCIIYVFLLLYVIFCIFKRRRRRRKEIKQAARCNFNLVKMEAIKTYITLYLAHCTGDICAISIYFYMHVCIIEYMNRKDRKNSVRRICE